MNRTKVNRNMNKIQKDANEYISIVERRKKARFFNEIKRPSFIQSIADYLSMNPMELINFLYIVNDDNVYLRLNINGYHLTELNFERLEEYLPIDILNRVTEFFRDRVDEDKDIYNEFCERLVDTGDLGLLFDIYKYDTEFFDGYVYGDVYKVSEITYTKEFMDFFRDVINALDEETVLEYLDELIEEF